MESHQPPQYVSPEWLREGPGCNEQYALRAFLQFNSEFRIKFYISYLIARYREWFEKHMPNCLRNTGGQIRIERMTPEDAAMLLPNLRPLNVLFHALVGLILAAIIYYTTVPIGTRYFLVLYFLLPWSGYTTSIQPETIAYFGVVMIGLSGTASPLGIMEGDASSPPSREGFGPERFYYIAGFVEQGRWARFTPPFFDQPDPVFELDSVGCCYLVNADLYRHGARHELDHASATFIAENRVWEEDAI